MIDHGHVDIVDDGLRVPLLERGSSEKIAHVIDVELGVELDVRTRVEADERHGYCQYRAKGTTLMLHTTTESRSSAPFPRIYTGALHAERVTAPRLNYHRGPQIHDMSISKQPDSSVEGNYLEARLRAQLFGPETATPVCVGRFEIVGRLGHGGMGVVYRARDPLLSREVALKLVTVSASDNEDQGVARQRVLREAQLLAQLAHPNVVTVYEVGEFGRQVFVAMELVEGGSLRERLDQTKSEDLPENFEATLDLLVQTGHGLAAAHAVGIVHRDFKPSNVLLGRDGRARVADFGLAWHASDLATMHGLGENLRSERSEAPRDHGLQRNDSVTLPGTVVGTYAYMAPEQRTSARVDARADQYAYCLTLAEALYGRRPDAIRGADHARPGYVPPWLDRIVARGLSPAPRDRFATMDALLAEIERHRKPRSWLSAFGLVVAAGVAITAGIAAREPESPPRCQTDIDTIDETVDADRMERLRHALVTAAPASGAVAASLLESRVSAWSQNWRSTRSGACESEDSIWTETLLDRQWRCLERQRRRLDGTLSALERATPSMVARLGEALPQPESVSICAQPTALQSDDTWAPASPTAIELLDLIARADGQLDVGALETARISLDQLEPRARALGDDLVSTRMWLSHGELHRQAQQPNAAVEAATRAMAAARRVDASADFSRAASLMIWASNPRGDQLDASRAWFEIAVARGDLSVSEMAYAKASFASSLARSGKADEAIDVMNRLIDTLRRVEPPEPTELAVAEFNLGMLLMQSNRLAEGETLVTRALPVFEKRFGEENARTLSARNASALSLLARGDLVAAEAQFRRLLEARSHVAGPGSLAVADTLYNLSLAVGALGNWSESEAMLARAADIYDTIEKPVDAAMARLERSQQLERMGRSEEAETLAADAIETFNAKLHVTHPIRLVGLAVRVEQLMDQERTAEARAMAVELRQHRGAVAEVGLEGIRIDLALAVEAWRGQPAEACAHVEMAVRAALKMSAKTPLGDRDLAMAPLDASNVPRLHDVLEALDRARLWQHFARCAAVGTPTFRGADEANRRAIEAWRQAGPGYVTEIAQMRENPGSSAFGSSR